MSVPTYPLDLTAGSSANRISNEIHTFNSASDRLFVMSAGPYYTEHGLALYDNNGALLRYSVDYLPMLMVVDAGEASSKEVCALMSVTKSNITSVSCNYQAVGGPYQNIRAELQSYLNSISEAQVVSLIDQARLSIYDYINNDAIGNIAVPNGYSYSANVTLSEAQRGTAVTITAPVTVTLPDPTATGGWCYWVNNASNAMVKFVTPHGNIVQTDEDGPGYTLWPNCAAVFTSDGVNWVMYANNLTGKQGSLRGQPLGLSGNTTLRIQDAGKKLIISPATPSGTVINLPQASADCYGMVYYLFNSSIFDVELRTNGRSDAGPTVKFWGDYGNASVTSTTIPPGGILVVAFGANNWDIMNRPKLISDDLGNLISQRADGSIYYGIQAPPNVASIFINNSGSDITGDGSRAFPFRTLTYALAFGPGQIERQIFIAEGQNHLAPAVPVRGGTCTLNIYGPNTDALPPVAGTSAWDSPAGAALGTTITAVAQTFIDQLGTQFYTEMGIFPMQNATIRSAGIKFIGCTPPGGQTQSSFNGLFFNTIYPGAWFINNTAVHLPYSSNTALTWGSQTTQSLSGRFTAVTGPGQLVRGNYSQAILNLDVSSPGNWQAVYMSTVAQALSVFKGVTGVTPQNPNSDPSLQSQIDYLYSLHNNQQAQIDAIAANNWTAQEIVDLIYPVGTAIVTNTSGGGAPQQPAYQLQAYPYANWTGVNRTYDMDPWVMYRSS